MAKTRVVMHIGPMKTGTTALGAYFSAATAAGILPSNVVYPVHPLWFPASGIITKHGQLADFLYPSGRHDSGRKTQFRKPEQVEQMVREVAAATAKLPGAKPTAVFISETLARSPNIERMASLLTSAFDEVTLVLAVRSPIEAAQSLLVHQIKDWRSEQVEFDLFGMLKSKDGSMRYDYQRMISRWRALPGVTVALTPYFEDESDGYAVVDRFMTIVTGKPAPRLGDDFGTRRIHPSLPVKSLERLISLKKVKLRFGRVPFVEGIVHKLFLRTLFTDRDKVVRAGFVARNVASGNWVITGADRTWILDMYGDLGGDLRSALGKDATSPEWRSWFKAVGL
jgi:hypothetical protein